VLQQNPALRKAFNRPSGQVPVLCCYVTERAERHSRLVSSSPHLLVSSEPSESPAHVNESLKTPPPVSHIHTYMYTHTETHIHVSLHTHTSSHSYTHHHTYIHTSPYHHIYTHTHTCLPTITFIHTHTITHTYIHMSPSNHIHTQRFSEMNRELLLHPSGFKTFDTSLTCRSHVGHM